MKLEYRYFWNLVSFFVGLFLFCFVYIISLEKLFLIILIIYIIYYVCFFGFGNFMKKYGNKKQGYIIDSCYPFNQSFFSGYGLIAFVDGDLYYVCGLMGNRVEKYFKRRLLKIVSTGICNNKAYKYICSELKKVEDMGNGDFKLRSFPIDVYVYRNKYYFDLASVELDMKNL